MKFGMLMSAAITAGVCMNGIAMGQEAESPIAEAMKKADAGVAKIVAIPESERTFANTVMALDDVLATLQIDTNMTSFLGYVSTDVEERTKGKQAEEDFGNWVIELGKNEGMYKALKAVSMQKIKLSPTNERLMKFMLRDYKRSGMELTSAQRDVLKGIEKKINELGIKFEGNIASDESVVLASEEELKGVPSDTLAGLKQTDGVYFVTMDYPTYNGVMDYCENPVTRERVWLTYKRRGGMKNVRVLEEILKLRSQAATMLGYATPAAFETEIRMAKNPEAVADFYAKLRPMVREKANADRAEMLAVKKSHTGDADAKFYPWDQQFCTQLLLKEKYAVDSQKVAEYFPMERAVEGLFGVTQSLYGIEYKDITDAARSNPPMGWKLWHEDVKMYEVWDKASKKLLGHFYIDLYPRENKYSHAACWGLVPRKKWQDGKETLPIAALVCNFTKPTKDKPSLLTHAEVETFFHEFGHCLHNILTTADTATFAGANVERDFVEAPSQMFENWVWDADVLKTFAKHYKTGEPIPPSLVDGMIKARNIDTGLFAERQFYYGLVDQSFHTAPKGEVDTVKVANEMFPQIETFAEVPNVYFHASFGHLVGYQAGYYSYQWSLVFAQDMMTKFKEMGMLNPKAGAYYREKILSRGGTMDAMDMLKDYLGREPKMDAYVEFLGLKPQQKAASAKPADATHN